MANTISKHGSDITRKFKVGMIVEFYREMDVVAVDKTEAGQLAEARIRSKHKVLSDLGYTIGDVEVINVESE